MQAPGDASYGRGVGEELKLACGQGRDKVGALCYDKCKTGYSVNKNNKLRCKPPGSASYTRAAGKIPHAIKGCRSGKQGGLCYDRCREGYREKVLLAIAGQKATIESLMMQNSYAQEEK